MQGKIFVIIGLFLISCAGCTPQKRIARILKNNPHLVTSDTIYKETLVKAPQIRKDTLFVLDTLFSKPDTFVVNNYNLETRVISHRDSIWVLQKPLEDSVVQTTREINHRPVVEAQLRDPMKDFLWMAFGVLAGILMAISSMKRD